MGNSLEVQQLGLHAFTAEGPGSSPGWRTKSPQAVRHGQRERKNQEDDKEAHSPHFYLALYWKS